MHDQLPRTSAVPGLTEMPRRVVRRLSDLRVGLARHVRAAVLLTGQRLPTAPLDVDVAGGAGREVGPYAEELV